MPTHFENLQRSLTNRRSTSVNIANNIGLALAEALTLRDAERAARRADGFYDEIDELETGAEYDERIQEIIELVDGSRPEVFEDLPPESKALIVRAIYVQDMDLATMSEEVQQIFLENVQPPRRVEDLISLGAYLDRGRCDIDLEVGPDDDEVFVKDEVLKKLPPNFMLNEILALGTDGYDIFNYMVEQDKVTVNARFLNQLAVQNIDFLNELYLTKYRDDPKPLKAMFKELNALGHGAGLRQHIEENGAGLDPKLIDIVKNSLKSQAEIDLENQTLRRVKVLENKRDKIKDDIEESKRPEFFKADNFMTRSTLTTMLVAGVLGAIFMVSGLYIVGAAMIAGGVLFDVNRVNNNISDEKRMFDHKLKGKEEQLKDIDGQIKEQKGLLSEEALKRPKAPTPGLGGASAPPVGLGGSSSPASRGSSPIV